MRELEKRLRKLEGADPFGRLSDVELERSIQLLEQEIETGIGALEEKELGHLLAKVGPIPSGLIDGIRHMNSEAVESAILRLKAGLNESH